MGQFWTLDHNSKVITGASRSTTLAWGESFKSICLRAVAITHKSVDSVGQLVRVLQWLNLLGALTQDRMFGEACPVLDLIQATLTLSIAELACHYGIHATLGSSLPELSFQMRLLCEKRIAVVSDRGQ